MAASWLRYSLLTVLFTLSPRARADVMLAPLFQDHLVLQQGGTVAVWGTADAGEKVTVSYVRGTTVVTAAATTAANHHWRVDLPALEASTEPATLTISGNNTITVGDVLVGEVWLCSGQSNMEWSVKWASGAPKEIAAGNHPLIRQFGVTKTSAAVPAETVKGDWRVCSPANVGEFSAVAYYFARELQEKLRVPVGIIYSSYGGTPVESWMSEAALKSDPAFSVVLDRIAQAKADWPASLAKYRADAEAWKQGEAAAKAAGQKFDKPKPRYPMDPGHPYMPMMEYNAMIYPLVPYAIRGAIWYQGEANASRASEYRGLFSAMIRQWRKEWGQGDFPFYFVQLANFKAGDADGVSWAGLREAQAQTLAVPNTGMAVTIDIGNPDSIHPGNKQEVGHRLARLALHRTYGDKDVVDSGPTFASATAVPGAPASVRVQFSNVAGGLKNNNPARLDAVLGFEIAGADKDFHAADARIEDASAGTVIVTVPQGIQTPVYVRYAWRNDPKCTLANGEGLPAAPFRTDH